MALGAVLMADLILLPAATFAVPLCILAVIVIVFAVIGELIKHRVSVYVRLGFRS